jgi:hypothetical protein
MNSTTTIQAAVLAYYPLIIPDAEPIPFDDPDAPLFGVGPSAIKNGLKVLVEPYDIMTVGDRVEVHWDDSGTSFASILVDTDNLHKVLIFSLSELRLVAGRFTPFYRIHRLSGIPLDSDKRHILVKLDLPGGIDPDPITDENENLAAPLLPQEIVDGGVDADWAKRGVPVTVARYPNIAEGDRIQLSWGGVFVWQTVEDSGQPVVITVPEATILLAGDNDSLVVRYQVFDVVGSRSGWSPRSLVKVFASDAPLLAPLIKDWPDAQIDLEVLAGKDVTVQVIAMPPDFAIGETVTMSWLGRTMQGLPVTHGQSLPVTSVPLILEFNVPNAKVQAIAQGAAAVSYALRKADGSTVLQSKRLSVGVRGAVRPLPRPDVSDVVGDVLAPTVSSVRVEIAAYATMAEDDTVTMNWSGVKENGQLYDRLQERKIDAAMVGKPVVFVVTNDDIAPLAGGRLTVSYQVRAQGVTLASTPLALRVAAFGVLYPPKVLEAVGNTQLDPSTLTAGVTVRVEPYDDMAIGDKITMHWDGTAGPGSVEQTKTVTRLGAVDFGVSLETVILNSDRQVDVYYQVLRNVGGISPPSMPAAIAVLGLGWKPFEINGWNPEVFNPLTGFDGANFRRNVTRNIGPVTYQSSHAEVTVNAADGVVTYLRRWSGTLTITARDGANRVATYRMPAPRKWIERSSLGQRTRDQFNEFVEANSSKGYRHVVDNTYTSGYGGRGLGYLWNEWGNLLFYGWSDVPNHYIWLSNRPNSAGAAYFGWLFQGFAAFGGSGSQAMWTVCYIDNA